MEISQIMYLLNDLFSCKYCVNYNEVDSECMFYNTSKNVCTMPYSLWIGAKT